MSIAIEAPGRPKPFRFDNEQFQEMLSLGWFSDRTVFLCKGQVVEKNTEKVATSARPWQWTGCRFYQMLDMNWFLDTRVELINGEILEMASQKNLHAATITLSADALQRAFGRGYWVRIQSTLDLSPISSPDPDLAVVRGNPRKPAKKNPTTALLLIEISDTSLYYDRNEKACIYAAAGMNDYWIVNLVARQVEVYRRPLPDPTKLLGFEYRDVNIFGPGERISPLALPRKKIAVNDMLPSV